MKWLYTTILVMDGELVIRRIRIEVFNCYLHGGFLLPANTSIHVDNGTDNNCLNFIVGFGSHAADPICENEQAADACREEKA